MYNKMPDLTALVGSRICHDLASPLGAISNGLELLELAGVADLPEVALLNDSIKAANGRMQFFRIAYGASADGAQLGRNTACQLLNDFFDDRRLNPQWNIAGDTPRKVAKLLFLLLQCMESGLPYGGTVTVEETDYGWKLDGRGRSKVDNPIWQLFGRDVDEDDIPSGDVHFVLARHAAQQLGLSLEPETGEDRILFRIRRRD